LIFNKRETIKAFSYPANEIDKLISLAFAAGAGALSNSGGASWSSSRDITISNPGGALTDYQVLVNLTGAAFPTGAKENYYI